MVARINPKFISTDMTDDTELAALEARVVSLETSSPSPEFVFVNSKSDLPAAVSGVITLANNYTYFITKTIDLTGDRLVAGQNTTLLGGSSENCFLISTGLSASTPLISSAWSLPMRSLSITHGTALNLDATGNANQAIDWFGVNFTNCATVGLIKNYNNFIMTDCALLNSANMTFDGTIGTIGFDQCLFSGIAAQTILNFPSTLTVSRRIRVIYSSFVSFGGATAIFVDPAVTFTGGAESYILITVNFSGGATYTGGLTYTSNLALFQNCKGITNTASIGLMYFSNNATQNPITTQSVFEKILGTTTASATNQKFSHTNNRLTYTGGIAKEFVVSASISANSVTTATANITVRIAKNGTTIADSESQATTSAAGRNENFFCQTIVSLAPNDFIEVFIANNTSGQNLLATELNLIVRAAD